MRNQKIAEDLIRFDNEGDSHEKASRADIFNAVAKSPLILMNNEEKQDRRCI
jgi:hypothetical protein